MNSHVIPSETIAKLKQLSKEVEDLTWEYSTFKKDADFYKLQEKQNEINQLIQKL